MPIVVDVYAYRSRNSAWLEQLLLLDDRVHRMTGLKW